MKITVLSKMRFDSLMKELNLNDENVKESKDYFISINYSHDPSPDDPYEENELNPYFSKDHPNVLRLYFDDVVQDMPIKLIANKEWVTAKAFTEADAAKVKAFADTITTDCNIYVHCLMGKSRSVAVGHWLSERFGIDPQLIYDREDMNPNVTVLRLLRSS